MSEAAAAAVETTPDIPTIGDALSALAEDARAAEAQAEHETAEPTEDEQAEPAKPEKAQRGKDGKFTKAAAAPKDGKGKSEPEPSKPAATEEPAEGELKEDFSDERPWTPERVKAAAAEAKQLARKAQGMWAQEQKRSAKLEAKRTEYLREKEQFRAIRDSLASDVQMLRTGDPRARLDALGRLTGQDGVQLWEELSVEMARGGKKAEGGKPSAEVLELREQVKELTALVRGRVQQDELSKQEQFIAQRKQELASVASDEESFPFLSEYSPDEVGDALAEVIVAEYNETGRRISDVKAAQILEQRLQEQAERLERAKAKRAGGAPQGASGLETRAKAKPGQAQSPPPNRGRSLAPGLSTKTPSTRELTDDEAEEDAADFIPATILAFAGAR